MSSTKGKWPLPSPAPPGSIGPGYAGFQQSISELEADLESIIGAVAMFAKMKSDKIVRSKAERKAIIDLLDTVGAIRIKRGKKYAEL